jgi:Rrf2 family protein
MHVNSRFAVAVHVLALVHFARGKSAGKPVTSERLAECVNRNPVVIRRILGLIRDAGLVTSQPGPGGGWQLTRRPSDISLRDVYRAVEGEPFFSLPHREPHGGCPAGKRVTAVLECCFRDAEDALLDRLAAVSIADVTAFARAGAERPEMSVIEIVEMEVTTTTI